MVLEKEQSTSGIMISDEEGKLLHTDMTVKNAVGGSILNMTPFNSFPPTGDFGNNDMFIVENASGSTLYFSKISKLYKIDMTEV